MIIIYTENINTANGIKVAVSGTIFGCVYDGTFVAVSGVRFWSMDMPGVVMDIYRTYGI